MDIVSTYSLVVHTETSACFEFETFFFKAQFQLTEKKKEKEKPRFLKVLLDLHSVKKKKKVLQRGQLFVIFRITF